MTAKFTPATRKKIKLRMALDGPPGAGKSYTGLRLAFALGARVAVIDTEAGSASKYSGDAPDGVAFAFDVLELDSFAPTEFTSAIEEAGRAGYDVILIDSLSHAWQGKDGALELVSKKGGNSYTAWKDVTPMHTRMIDAILRSPAHVIATMRSKVDYVLETDDKGKQVPRKVGMAPIQRAGMEYEFDVYGSLDWSHILTITKSRCPAIDAAVVVKPGPAFLAPVLRWLETGESVRVAPAPRIMVEDTVVERIVGKIAALGRQLDREKKEIFKRYTASEFADLTGEQAADYERRLDVALAKMPKAAPPTEEPPTAGATSRVDPPAPTKPSNGTATPPAATTTATASVQQLNRLLEARAEFFHLKGEADPDKQAPAWSKVLAKRGVSRDAELSPTQATELIGSIDKAIATMREEKGLPPF